MLEVLGIIRPLEKVLIFEEIDPSECPSTHCQSQGAYIRIVVDDALIDFVMKKLSTGHTLL